MYLYIEHTSILGMEIHTIATQIEVQQMLLHSTLVDHGLNSEAVSWLHHPNSLVPCRVRHREREREREGERERERGGERVGGSVLWVRGAVR